MKRIDRLVMGSRHDLALFQEYTEGQDGVVFARPNGGRSNALDAYRPRQALFLSPYRGMAADAARLVGNGVDVRTAGPLPGRTRRPDIPITDIHRSDPGFSAMLEASRHADFGDPVYLRIVSSPAGGKWQKWWRAFQACRKAAALLDSPLWRVYVAAAGKAPRLHVSITLRTVRDSTGHLLVTPSGSDLQDDLFFLGTGGTLSDDPLLNQPGVYGQSDYRMLSRPDRWCLADLWDDDAVISLTVGEQCFYQDLLRAIGGSSRTGSGVCLEYPAA